MYNFAIKKSCGVQAEVVWRSEDLMRLSYIIKQQAAVLAACE